MKINVNHKRNSLKNNRFVAYTLSKFTRNIAAGRRRSTSGAEKPPPSKSNMKE